MLGLSAHARLRMRQRGIAEEEIEEALANVENSWPSDDDPDNRIVVLGTSKNGKRLKVVVTTEDTEYVVTVADRDDER